MYNYYGWGTYCSFSYYQESQMLKQNNNFTAYKGLHNNMKCMEFQYKVGQTYEMSKSPRVCSNGFHACRKLEDVFGYYGFWHNRFVQVQILGEVSEEGDKLATNKIKIEKLLKLDELVKILTTQRAHPTTQEEYCLSRNSCGTTGYSGKFMHGNNLQGQFGSNLWLGGVGNKVYSTFNHSNCIIGGQGHVITMLNPISSLTVIADKGTVFCIRNPHNNKFTELVAGSEKLKANKKQIIHQNDRENGYKVRA